MKLANLVRSFRGSTTACVALAVSCMAAFAAAQATIAEIEPPLGFDYLGAKLAGMGDVNADGHADYVVHLDYKLLGAVELVSGADGSVLHLWKGTVSAADFGFALDAAGDVDGDGLSDVLVGEPGPIVQGYYGPGHVYVFSSASGLLLHDLSGDPLDRLGLSVAGVGDIDGDGRGDIAAGAPNQQDATGYLLPGYVKVYSGASGAELVKLVGDFNGQQFGRSVRPAGDTNADGVPDVAVLIGDFMEDLRVYSGAWIAHGTAPALLMDLTAVSCYGGIDRAGDIDGDGFDDLLIGTPVDGSYYPGGLYVLSGKDQSKLLEYLGSTFAKGLGIHVAGAGDLDHDGVPDLLASGPGSPDPPVPGGAVAVSGRTGALLGSVDEAPAPTSGTFGTGLAGVGDVNADGTPDWAVTSFWESALRLYSQVGLWTDVGQGLAGANGIPHLSGAGLLQGGTQVSLHLKGALPSTPLALVVGLFAVNLPLKGGVLVPDSLFVLSDHVSDGLGGLTVAGTLPLDAPQSQLWFQVWQPDAAGPFGYVASNALHAQVP